MEPEPLFREIPQNLLESSPSEGGITSPEAVINTLHSLLSIYKSAVQAIYLRGDSMQAQETPNPEVRSLIWGSTSAS